MLQIDEIGTVGERILHLIGHFSQGNKTAFGRVADIQSGVLAGIVGGRESKPGFEILQKILTAYPTVNPTWLLFGREEMLRPEEATWGNSPVDMKREVDVVHRRMESLKEQLSGLREQYNSLTTKALALGFAPDAVLEAAQQAEYNQIRAQQQALVERGRPVREELISLSSYFENKNRQFDYMLERISLPQATLSSIYRTKGEPDFTLPSYGLLTKRLSISEATAQQLITQGLLRAVNVGEEGYRVTELAVRELLGEASAAN